VAGLSVEVTAAGDRSLVRVVGELDLDSAAILRRPVEAELSAEPTHAVTLDLAELTFVDSSGLALLVELRRLASGAGVQLDIVNVRPGPQRVISIAGLAETLGVPPAPPHE
jgi:anti-sigma B factor antagonist